MPTSSSAHTLLGQPLGACVRYAMDTCAFALAEPDDHTHYRDSMHQYVEGQGLAVCPDVGTPNCPCEISMLDFENRDRTVVHHDDWKNMVVAL